jgi:hypothetical protein
MEVTKHRTGRPPLDPHAGAGSAPVVGTRMPRHLLDALNEAATRRGLPRAVAVREALAAWIDADEAATA